MSRVSCPKLASQSLTSAFVSCFGFLEGALLSPVCRVVPSVRTCSECGAHCAHSTCPWAHDISLPVSILQHSVLRCVVAANRVVLECVRSLECVLSHPCVQEKNGGGREGQGKDGVPATISSLV